MSTAAVTSHKCYVVQGQNQNVSLAGLKWAACVMRRTVCIRSVAGVPGQ